MQRECSKDPVQVRGCYFRGWFAKNAKGSAEGLDRRLNVKVVRLRVCIREDTRRLLIARHVAGRILSLPSRRLRTPDAVLPSQPSNVQYYRNVKIKFPIKAVVSQLLREKGKTPYNLSYDKGNPKYVEESIENSALRSQPTYLHEHKFAVIFLSEYVYRSMKMWRRANARHRIPV